MIALFLLLGIALVVVAGAIFGKPAVIALAGILAVAAVIGVVSDVWRAWRDRRMVRRRWTDWELADRRRAGRRG
jgi:hypothetical protein